MDSGGPSGRLDLYETNAICKLSLLFGATWVVNAIVISAFLDHGACRQHDRNAGNRGLGVRSEGNPIDFAARCQRLDTSTGSAAHHVSHGR